MKPTSASDWLRYVHTDGTIPLGDPKPDALAVLHPGDRVLCVFRDADLEHVHNGLKQMRLRFPDVEFSALVGADQVLVQPSEEPTDA